MITQYCSTNRLIRIFLMLALAVNASSCSTRAFVKETESFNKAEEINTKAAYNSFLQQYADSKYNYFISVAKQRLSESDEDAFIRTCQIGHIKSFWGFLEDYPDSKKSSLVKSRIAFIETIEKGNLDASKLFIAQNPDNPFIYEAISASPLIWLEEVKKKTGLHTIEIRTAKEFRSSIGNANLTGKSLQNIISDAENALKEIGIFSTTNDSPTEQIDLVFNVHIKEKREYIEPSVLSELIVPGITGAVTAAVTGALTGGLFALSVPVSPGSYNRIEKYYAFSIQDKNGSLEFYSDIVGLNEKAPNSEIIRSLRFFGEAAMPSLIFAINANDFNVQRAAIDVLKNIKSPDAIEVLIRAFNHCNVGEDAARALVEIGEPAVVPLIVALKDSHADVRQFSAMALAEIKDPRAIEPLILALKDNDFSVRLAAAKALGEMHELRAIKPLIDTLKVDTSNTVQMVAVKSLEKITGRDYGDNAAKWEAFYESIINKR